ncbi:MAG: endonuclease/exonuclease/phosphatase family protein [Flavobacteriaceae bacterium]|nr:endonuclease/exonuclease/phosphatase family protein [Flavobacteriaceae bacterium]
MPVLIVQEQPKNQYTFAFYNLENLFDIYDDPNTLDDDFTPQGIKKWNRRKYERKLKRMASVIVNIGREQTGFPPAVIGVAEVENQLVVNNLLDTLNKKGFDYGSVHYESPDERGVDVALLYRKSVFEVLESKPVTLYIEDERGERDYTRDVLLVKGNFQGVLVYFIVNHWPSRRAGTGETEYKRIKAAQLVGEIIGQIEEETTAVPIVIMGDFNDDPTSQSVKYHLVNDTLYNPFESILARGTGSLNHEMQWHLFDQIIVSRSFFDTAGLEFQNAAVFKDHSITEWKGKYKGNPFRTYIGKWYQGGASDHFPVYITVTKK